MPDVTWHAGLYRDDAEPVVAWVFSLVEAGGLAGLAPTTGDKRDAADRRGLEADRFLARRSLLRHLVACRCGLAPASVEIGYTAVGAPVVLSANRPVFCSVAARGDLAAIALADRPVGVDLEPVESGPIPWAVLAESERAWLAARDARGQAEVFLQIWTAKEAYLKGRGSGLNTDPSTLTVTIDPPTLRDGAAVRPLPSSTWFRRQFGARRIIAACIVL